MSMDEERPLTRKQRRYVDAYDGPGTGAAAAREAGYPAQSAREQSSQNLALPHVRRAIALKNAELIAEAGIDPAEHAAKLADDGIKAELPRDRIRANELILKLAGFYDEEAPSQQHNHLHLDGVSLEDMLALEQRLLAEDAAESVPERPDP